MVNINNTICRAENQETERERETGRGERGIFNSSVFHFVISDEHLSKAVDRCLGFLSPSFSSKNKLVFRHYYSVISHVIGTKPLSRHCLAADIIIINALFRHSHVIITNIIILKSGLQSGIIIIFVSFITSRLVSWHCITIDVSRDSSADANWLEPSPETALEMALIYSKLHVVQMGLSVGGYAGWAGKLVHRRIG